MSNDNNVIDEKVVNETADTEKEDIQTPQHKVNVDYNKFMKQNRANQQNFNEESFLEDKNIKKLSRNQKLIILFFGAIGLSSIIGLQILSRKWKKNKEEQEQK